MQSIEHGAELAQPLDSLLGTQFVATVLMSKQVIPAQQKGVGEVEEVVCKLTQCKIGIFQATDIPIIRHTQAREAKNFINQTTQQNNRETNRPFLAAKQAAKTMNKLCENSAQRVIRMQ